MPSVAFPAGFCSINSSMEHDSGSSVTTGPAISPPNTGPDKPKFEPANGFWKSLKESPALKCRAPSK